MRVDAHASARSPLLHPPPPGSPQLAHLELHCPALEDPKLPPLPAKPRAARPLHAPIAAMMRDNARDAALAAAAAAAAPCGGDGGAARGGSGIPAVHRPMA